MGTSRASDPDRRPYPDPDDPAVWRVPLADGGFAVVDEEDVCRVDQCPWYRSRSKGGRRDYALTRRQEGGRQITTWMHRHLFGLGPHDRVQVDHRNHDGLDNRRANLRLATPAQNSANRRTGRGKASAYKGVFPRSGRWTAIFSSNAFGVGASISLGSYGAEEEAAFAFRVAAGFMRDPGFVHSDPIPPDRMPSPGRLAEIEAVVIAKIKARLEGRKGKLDSTSRYSGVDYHPRVSASRPWRAMTSVDGRSVYLGYYPSEAQAALAYNVALERYPNFRRRRPNVVPESEMPPPETVAAIREQASAALSRPPLAGRSAQLDRARA